MRSAFTSSKSLSGGLRRLIRRFTSANRASKSCALVGAVKTALDGVRQRMCQTAAMATAVDLPTPWPERTLMRRFLGSATALRNSTCHSSGSMPSASLANNTGSLPYRRARAKNGLSSLRDPGPGSGICMWVLLFWLQFYENFGGRGSILAGGMGVGGLVCRGQAHATPPPQRQRGGYLRGLTYCAAAQLRGELLRCSTT